MNWVSFTEGFMFGIGAAIPLGPINILIMSTALRSYPSAVAIGFGAMSADIIYLLSILLGMVAFAGSPGVMPVLGIIGSVFLFYIAWSIFRSRNQKLHLAGDTEAKILPNYLKGLSLTLLNPYTIVFWVSVSAYIQTRHLDTLFTVAGLLSAIVCWITLMPLSIHKTKHLLSGKAVTAISVISSLLLAFFALAMLYRLFS